MGETGKGPVSEDIGKHWLLKQPANSDKGTLPARALTNQAHTGN